MFQLRNLLKYIGLRHLRAHPGRAFLTLLGVAFGIALYVAVAIINYSTRDSLRKNVESVSGKAKISITSDAGNFLEEVLDQVKSVSGVKSAVPLLEVRAFLKESNDVQSSLMIFGVDLLQESAVRAYQATRSTDDEANERVIDDPLVFLNQPDSIIVTRDLADRLKLKLEDSLPLMTTLGPKVFKVRGFLKPSGMAKAFGGSLAIMDIDGARLMFGQVDKLSRIDLVIDEQRAIEPLIADLKQKLGPGYVVDRPEEMGKNAERVVESYQQMLTLFSSLALLVGLILIFNSVSVAVVERRKEIGILRALGATRGGILGVFLAESIVLGVLGNVLGIGIGRLLANWMSQKVTVALSNQTHSVFQVSELQFPLSIALTSLGLGLAASMLAAFFPSYKATLVHPLESMRAYVRSQSKSFLGNAELLSRWMAIFGAVLLLVSLVVMMLGWTKIHPYIDLASQQASVVGVAFLGPTLVLFLIEFGERVSRPIQSAITKLSFANVLRNRGRTKSNVMTLMVGLSFVMIVAAIRISFEESMLSWVDEAFSADLVVTGGGRMVSSQVQPVDEKIARELSEIPGVRSIEEGRGYGSRTTFFLKDGKNFCLRAFDRPLEASGYRHFPIRDANRNEVIEQFFKATRTSDLPGILVSENFFMKNPNVKVGDLFQLDSPSGPIQFKILAKVRDFTSAEGVFYITRDVYKKFWRDTSVSGFWLYTEPGVPVLQVRDEIDRRLGKKYGLTAYLNSDIRDSMKKLLDESFSYTKLIEWISLCVALLGLLNTILISVLERTREIGVLRATSATRGQIRRLILSESVIQGGFGAIVAILLGVWVGRVYVKYSMAATLGWSVDFYVPYASLLGTFLLGISVALIAGLYPARRASHLKITEAISAE
jgi:putative ABC transport system permease protein